MLDDVIASDAPHVAEPHPRLYLRPLSRWDSCLEEDVFKSVAGSFTDRRIRNEPFDHLDSVQSVL